MGSEKSNSNEPDCQKDNNFKYASIELFWESLWSVLISKLILSKQMARLFKQPNFFNFVFQIQKWHQNPDAWELLRKSGNKIQLGAQTIKTQQALYLMLICSSCGKVFPNWDFGRFGVWVAVKAVSGDQLHLDPRVWISAKATPGWGTRSRWCRLMWIHSQ